METTSCLTGTRKLFPKKTAPLSERREVSSDGNDLPSDGDEASSEGNDLPSDGDEASSEGNDLPSDGDEASSEGSDVSSDGNEVSSEENGAVVRRARGLFRRERRPVRRERRPVRRRRGFFGKERPSVRRARVIFGKERPPVRRARVILGRSLARCNREGLPAPSPLSISKNAAKVAVDALLPTSVPDLSPPRGLPNDFSARDVGFVGEGARCA